jgi:hypothetical protein
LQVLFAVCQRPDGGLNSVILIDGKVMFEIAPHFTGANATRQERLIEEIGPSLKSTLESYRLRILETAQHQ